MNIKQLNEELTQLLENSTYTYIFEEDGYAKCRLEDQEIIVKDSNYQYRRYLSDFEDDYSYFLDGDADFDELSDINEFEIDTQTDLAEYISTNLKNVVKSIKLNELVYTGANTFKSKWNITTTSKLTEQQEDELKDYMRGQMSDGWGENEEEQSYIGTLYIEGDEHMMTDDDGESVHVYNVTEEVDVKVFLHYDGGNVRLYQV